MAKSIYGMSMDGDEPPPQYVVKGDNKPESEKLRSALTSAGCFQAIGHGMSTSYLHKIRQVSKQFFQLPVEEKQKYARAANDSEGYGNDRILSKKQNRRRSLWPQNPIDFSEILEEFSIKVKSMMDYLLRCMGRPNLVLKPHTNRSVITVLMQDNGVEGLQVLIDEKWVNVPTIPNALVVNHGDQMQSPKHRVVTYKEKMRMSVAMSYEPESENEIGPVESLITDTRPRLYKNVRNYGEINYRCYQEGKIPLEMVKYT
ncbi:hypothetical protein AHAS_Ahas01G0231100 [Arachis hypogaea]